ncbi:MAG: hypothetical protein L3K03_08340 [Thermoplasmata archaeon]|nr:hypothetical protein [Thermoplasmata archaeon]
MAVVVVLFVLTGNGWSFPAPSHSVPGSNTGLHASELTVASRQLAAASSSIELGHGPPSAPVAPPLSASSGSWTDLTDIVGSNVPTSRWIPTMAYDPVDQYVVLFGGYGGTWDSDTWTYANGVWTELTPTLTPPARYGASMTWDAHDGYILLFGGLADTPVEEPLNDTWTFLHGQWTDVTANSTLAPQARWRQVMVYDPVDQYVVLYGGTNFSDEATAERMYTATWIWSDGNWTDIQKNVTGNPPGTFRAEATWDAADGYMVMFGGCTTVATTSCATDNTFTYVNDTWTNVTSSPSPPASEYVGITYNPLLGSVILFGGTNSVSFYAETWSFSAGVWSELSPSPAPGGRAYVGMTFDGFDGYLLVFGGATSASGDFLNETWAFGPSIIGTLQESSAQIDIGQSTILNATPLAYSGYVAYNWTTLPQGCSAGNVSVVVCTPDQTGRFAVNVSVNDSHGIPANRSTTLVVNTDPALTGFSASLATVTVGTSTVLQLTDNSGGTSPYVFSYASLPPGCSSANTAALTCTPTSAGPGSFLVNASLRDAVGWRSYSTLALTVNARPSFLSTSAVPGAIDLGQSSTLYANVTGGTGPLSYAYWNLPPGCATADQPSLACTPSSTGDTVLAVNVTDVYGWSVNTTIPLVVNTDPTGTLAISQSTIDLGQPLAFWFNATGGTGLFQFQYSGLPTGCSLGSVASGGCTPTGTGSFQVIGTATDAAGKTVSANVVVAVNPVPLITAGTAAPSTIDVGQTTWINVTSSGGTAPLTYIYTDLPTGCTTSNVASLTCLPTGTGPFKVLATISDRFGSVSKIETIALTVNPDPSITGFTAVPATITVGDYSTLTVGTHGGTSPLSYSYSGLPAGCAGSSASILNCTPSSSGTFNVTVTVTDAVGEHQTQSLVLTVNPLSGGSSPDHVNAQSSASPWLPIGIGILLLAAIVAAAVLLARRRRSSPSEPESDSTPTDEESPPPTD